MRHIGSILVASLYLVGCSGEGDDSEENGSESGGQGGDGDAPSGPWDGEPEGVPSGGSITVSFNGDPPVSGKVHQASYTSSRGYFSVIALVDGDLFMFDVSSELMGVGTFDCGDPMNASLLTTLDNTRWASAANDDCVLTVTEFGEVGGPVRGSFSSTLSGDGSETISVDGTFDLIRGSSESDD